MSEEKTDTTVDKKTTKEEHSFENIQEAMLKRFGEDIKQVSSDLTASFNSEPLAQLREDLFVNIFLPFFSGEENTYNVGLGNWETVAANKIPGANGLYKEVEVVDNTGQVLFRVPPIYDLDAINPTKLSNTISLEDLFKQAEILALIKPQLAVKNNSLIFSRLLSKMKVNKNNSESYLLRWREIFRRYGKYNLTPIDNDIEDDDKGSLSNVTDYEIEDI